MGPAICKISTISIALDSKMTSWLCQSLGLSKWLLPLLQEGLECVTWKLLLTIHSICCSIISHSPYSNKRSKPICCPSSRHSTWTLSSSRNSFKNSICCQIFLEDLQPKLKQIIQLYSFQAFISFKILEDYLKQKLKLGLSIAFFELLILELVGKFYVGSHINMYSIFCFKLDRRALNCGLPQFTSFCVLGFFVCLEFLFWAFCLFGWFLPCKTNLTYLRHPNLFTVAESERDESQSTQDDVSKSQVNKELAQTTQKTLVVQNVKTFLLRGCIVRNEILILCFILNIFPF